MKAGELRERVTEFTLPQGHTDAVIVPSGTRREIVCGAFKALREYLEEKANQASGWRFIFRAGIRAVTALLDEYIESECGDA